MLSQLGLIMFLRNDNLLYRDRALFSVGVHVTESEPGCVQHFSFVSRTMYASLFCGLTTSQMAVKCPLQTYNHELTVLTVSFTAIVMAKYIKQQTQNRLFKGTLVVAIFQSFFRPPILSASSTQLMVHMSLLAFIAVD